MKPFLAVMNPRRNPRCIEAIRSLPIDKVWLSNMTEKELEPIVDSVVTLATLTTPDIEDEVARGEKFSLLTRFAERRTHKWPRSPDEELDRVSEKSVRVDRPPLDGEPYTHMIMLSDDTVPTADALEKVLTRIGSMQEANVVTAYCNLDAVRPHVNLTRRHFLEKTSVASDYDWMTKDEADGSETEQRWGYPVRSYFAGMSLTGMSLAMWSRFPFRVITRPGAERGYGSDWMLSARLQACDIPIYAPRGAFIEHVKAKWNDVFDNTEPERRLLVDVEPAGVHWRVGERRHDLPW